MILCKVCNQQYQELPEGSLTSSSNVCPFCVKQSRSRDWKDVIGFIVIFPLGIVWVICLLIALPFSIFKDWRYSLYRFKQSWVFNINKTRKVIQSIKDWI